MNGFSSAISSLLETTSAAAVSPAVSTPPNAVTTPSASGARKDDAMTINTNSEDYKAGHQAGIDAGKKTGLTEGFKAASDRFAKVSASEHYVGREALAASLLANDAMTADAIIDALSKAPKPVAQAEEVKEKSQEEKDREAMRARLNGNNPDLGADQGGKSKEEIEAAEAADNYGWGKIHEEVRNRRAA